MKSVLICTATLALFGAMIAEAATDVSSQVKVTHTGYGRNRSTGLWATTMTVSNTSGVPIKGPVQVVLTHLSANATMVNASGTQGTDPYITVAPDSIPANGAVQVVLQFQNPTNDYITFTPVTETGTIP